MKLKKFHISTGHNLKSSIRVEEKTIETPNKVFYKINFKVPNSQKVKNVYKNDEGVMIF